MALFHNVHGTHKVVTLSVPGRPRARMLCLTQTDSHGHDAYYVLAECESPASALRWRSMVRDNTVRRLKDEFIDKITVEQEVDSLDVETIFLCTTAASKA